MNTMQGCCKGRMVSGHVRTQKGAALVVGLIFLVLVSLIATVGMRQSITQERMAGGLRNDSLARNGAESAQRQGERLIYDWYLVSNNAQISGPGVYDMGDVASSAFRDANPNSFFTTGALAYDPTINDYTTNPGFTSRLAQQPVYLIELGGVIRPPNAPGGEGGDSGVGGYSTNEAQGNSYLSLFRVTARSTGGVDTVVRTVESTFVGITKG